MSTLDFVVYFSEIGSLIFELFNWLFRAAKNAEIASKIAKSRGISINDEERFDTNCITPGILTVSLVSFRGVTVN